MDILLCIKAKLFTETRTLTGSSLYTVYNKGSTKIRVLIPLMFSVSLMRRTHTMHLNSRKIKITALVDFFKNKIMEMALSLV